MVVEDGECRSRPLLWSRRERQQKVVASDPPPEIVQPREQSSPELSSRHLFSVVRGAAAVSARKDCEDVVKHGRTVEQTRLMETDMDRSRGPWQLFHSTTHDEYRHWTARILVAQAISSIYTSHARPHIAARTRLKAVEEKQKDVFPKLLPGPRARLTDIRIIFPQVSRKQRAE